MPSAGIRTHEMVIGGGEGGVFQSSELVSEENIVDQGRTRC